jgi:endonuclease/exonuclease/phosphatase family metal-dependent hydrolase
MLKVMTLNINAYETKYGPWDTRKRLIGDVLRQTEPDVVALQAVRLEPGIENDRHQARQLADAFPEYRHVAFQEAIKSSDGAVEGPAILSKAEIVSVDHLRLSMQPGKEDPNRRILLNVLLDHNGQRIRLFNAQFSWVYDQTLLNASETLKYLDSYSEPALLVGDLNATPESYPMVKIRSSEWTDVWGKLHPKDPGYTFESGKPEKRIDYIWANQALKDKIEEIAIVADNQDAEGIRPSDHLGLLAILNL